MPRCKIRDFNNSIESNAATDLVSVTTDNLFNFNTTDDFTFTTWIKTTSTASIHRLFSRRSTTGYILQTASNRTFDFFVNDGANRNCTFTPKKHIFDGSWHFVAYIVRSSVREVWQNAKQLTLLSGTPDMSGFGSIAAAGLTLRLGDTGSAYIGMRQQDRVFSHALSQTELENLFYNGKLPLNGSTLELEYLYPDSDAGGGTLKDSSENGFTGTLTSMSWRTDSPFGARAATAARSAISNRTAISGRVAIT